LLRWKKVDQGLSVFEPESIEIYQSANEVRDAVGGAADHATTVRMSAQNHIREFFPPYEVRHIGDVSGQVDTGGVEVRAFADSGESRGEDVVSGGPERFTNSFPAPASVPGSVYKDVSGHGEESNTTRSIFAQSPQTTPSGRGSETNSEP
jgi:hypothetical protein